MVSSAVFGAAAGTGLALVVAMTIVVYRYYAVKRKGKYWNNLDRWPDPPSTKKPEGHLDDCSEYCHDSSSSHVLNCWRKQQKNYYAIQNGVCTKHSCCWTNSFSYLELALHSCFNIAYKRYEQVKILEDLTMTLGISSRLTFDCRNRYERGLVDPSDISVVLDTFVKVPGKLSEVLGDVLELACGGGGGGGGSSSGSGGGGGGGGGNEAGGKSGNSSSIGNAASRIGVVTGVATIRDKWAQRSHRSPLSSVATTDSADSTTSTSSEVTAVHFVRCIIKKALTRTRWYVQ
ncbi:hypothetical protein ANTQUA_LOCUS3754, partial [Anthophora quadrimaculata]